MRALEALDAQARTNGGQLFLWFEHDADQRVTDRLFRVFGTGNPIIDHPTTRTSEWRATVEAAPFVWHVYEAI